MVQTLNWVIWGWLEYVVTIICLYWLPLFSTVPYGSISSQGCISDWEGEGLCPLGRLLPPRLFIHVTKLFVNLHLSVADYDPIRASFSCRQSSNHFWSENAPEMIKSSGEEDVPLPPSLPCAIGTQLPLPISWKVYMCPLPPAFCIVSCQWFLTILVEVGSVLATGAILPMNLLWYKS